MLLTQRFRDVECRAQHEETGFPWPAIGRMLADAVDVSKAKLLEFVGQRRLPCGISLGAKVLAKGVTRRDERATCDLMSVVQCGERWVELPDLQLRRRVARYVVIGFQVGLNRFAWNV